MSANLNVNEKTGRVSFAGSNPAWHNQGQIFNRPMTVAEALSASGADYEIGLQPICPFTPEMMRMISENDTIDTGVLLRQMEKAKAWKSTMRLDNGQPLGMVSQKYGIVQNKEAFEFIDMLVTGKKAERGGQLPVIETAGVLGMGETAFVSVKFPESIRLDNREENNIDMYVVFKTSHDGTGSLRVMVTPIRVVCQNTLNWATKKADSKISLRHSANVSQRLDLMNEENANFTYRTLGLYDIYKKSLEEDLKRLRLQKVGDKDLENILASLCFTDANLEIYKKTGNPLHEDITSRARNIFSAMNESMVSGVGQEFCESGTGDWVMNGITTYYANDARYKDIERRADSILDGLVSNKVQAARQMLYSLEAA